MSLKANYFQKFRGELQKELGLRNLLAVPKLEKIVVNIGLGEALSDRSVLEKASKQLAAITGQKPQATRARRSIASFKLRAGDTVGLKVTLRGNRMYAFFEKLVSIALPRLRDFRGVPSSGFDGRGKYNLGLQEQTIFPDLDYNQIDKTRGLQISFVTTAADDKSGKLLLEKLGMPFEKQLPSRK